MNRVHEPFQKQVCPVPEEAGSLMAAGCPCWESGQGDRLLGDSFRAWASVL